MRRIAVLCLLLLCGCGSSAPSSVVPADASVYLGVDASEAERIIMRLTSRDDVDFERDVRPWLGDRAAYFAVESADAGGIVLASEDDEAAEAFARKVTAAGPMRASAIVDGHLVLAASRELLRATNAAAGGESLADSIRLDVAGEDEEGAPEILLATREPGALDDGLQLVEWDELDLPELGNGPLTARIWDDRTEITGLPEVPAAPSLSDVPGAAWLATASVDMSAGDGLSPLRDQLGRFGRWPAAAGLDELLRPLLREGIVYVQGRQRFDIGGRVVAGTPDAPAARRAIVAYARALPRRRYQVDLHRNPTGLQLLVSPRRRLMASFFLQIDHGRVTLDMGRDPGGVADDLADTPRYRDAERRLYGPPTLLIERDGGYLAARREGSALTVVTRAG